MQIVKLVLSSKFNPKLKIKALSDQINNSMCEKQPSQILLTRQLPTNNEIVYNDYKVFPWFAATHNRKIRLLFTVLYDKNKNGFNTVPASYS
jgi:hypothetical protein